MKFNATIALTYYRTVTVEANNKEEAKVKASELDPFGFDFPNKGKFYILDDSIVEVNAPWQCTECGAVEHAIGRIHYAECSQCAATLPTKDDD